MRNLFLTALIVPGILLAEPSSTSTPSSSVPQPSIQPFTGKITRNKVRLRLQPSLESAILRELDRGDFVLVTGEDNEFYAIKAPEDSKAYVFRTFVLDNTVEGEHVNVRLLPDKESPVIAQLNSGSRIDGKVSPLNSKWLEIQPPESVKFYVCKDYVENLGPPELITSLQSRRNTAKELLDVAQKNSQVELEKPFEEMRIEPILASLHKLISDDAEFTDQAAQAKELLKSIQDIYLQKKLAYLESKSSSTNYIAPSPSKQEQFKPQEPINGKAASWLPAEQALYQMWSSEHDDASIEEFYEKQKQSALILTGIIEPFVRYMRNKPGDYLLISKKNRMPVAYLYSTKVDLAAKTGQEVTLIAVPRPNNNFAHPAYFVLSME